MPSRFQSPLVRFRWSQPLRGAFALVFVVGCNLQGEGDFCAPEAGGSPPGSNDCQTGLVCTEISKDVGFRCCLPQGLRSQSAAAVCALPATSSTIPSVPADSSAADGTLNEEGGGGDDATTVDQQVDGSGSDVAVAEASGLGDGSGGDGNDDGGSIDAGQTDASDATAGDVIDATEAEGASDGASE